MKIPSQYNPSSPYTFKRVEKKIRNRTLLAAMTNKQSFSNGIISNEEIEWLSERARGGFGIITTAATNVSIESKAWEGEFGVYDDMHIPNLKKLTSKIHYSNSIIFAQLFHGGSKSPESLTGKVPISASELICKESKLIKCRKANQKDLDKIIFDFTMAAIRCVKSGFDGIELHGAHGYLISQFLGEKTNLRNDKWGGTLKKRSRLLIKICESIKNNVPETFLVGVRISPEIDSLGINIDDTIKLVSILKNLELDFIHLSCWDVFSSSLHSHNDSRTLTQIITESCFDLPTIISTGGIWSSMDAQNTLKQGADIVGVGRVAIAFPKWADKISRLNYNPQRPPFSINHLKKAKLGDQFINYMKKWDNFVED